MNREEIVRLETYLRKLFQLDSIEVRQRPNKDDSSEVYIGDEFIGVMFRDDDDGDLSYNFQMAILDYDLQSYAGLQPELEYWPFWRRAVCLSTVHALTFW